MLGRQTGMGAWLAGLETAPLVVGAGSTVLTSTFGQTIRSGGQIDVGTFTDLGTLAFGGRHGHQGETLGHETIALTNPDSGISVAMASNSCGVLLQYLTILSALHLDIRVR